MTISRNDHCVSRAAAAPVRSGSGGPDAGARFLGAVFFGVAFLAALFFAVVFLRAGFFAL
ncbi:MAG TPA: hypothetical protein VFA34_05345 [Actinomycetota bacterium]|nr:hypothetical protein [Actinomycetota bacterium]